MTKAKNQTVTVGETVPINSIKEVQDVEDLKFAIDALKGEFPEVFMRLNQLIDEYNIALEAADKAVRAKGISCGPFVNKSVTVRYDGQKMYDELGEDLFLDSGGSLSKTTSYVIDRQKVEAAIASGKIAEESLEHFRTVSRAYSKPDTLVKP